VYTQCPECQTAFRITTEVLEKAGGRVRCGGCGVAFSAVDHLSDSLPGSASNSSATAGDEGSSENFEEKSKSLLETLEQLAGDQNVRIEDTGVEWRVLDENEVDESSLPLQKDVSADEEQIRYRDSGIVEQLDAGETSQENASNADSAQESLDLQHASPGERRYDDDTQLPDDFAEEDDIPYTPQPELPQRRASDEEDHEKDFDTHQVDMALGDDKDWGELLDDDEVVAESEDDDLARQLEEAEAQQIADDSAMLPKLAEELVENLQQGDDEAAAGIPFEVEEELAAIHSDLGAIGSANQTAQQVPNDLDSQFNLQAEALGLDITRNDETEPDADIGDGAGDNAPDDEQVLTHPDDVMFVADNEDERPLTDDVKFVADNEDERPLTDDDEITEDHDEGELSAEEEADIVQKLRDSTGSFQKQIDAAQRALDQHDGEERDNTAEEAEPDEPEDADESDTEADPNSIEAQLAATYSDLAKAELSTTESNGADDEQIAAAADDDEDASEDEDSLEQTMIRAGIDPSHLQGDNIETIIMEGDYVRGALEVDAPEPDENDDSAITELEVKNDLVDTYMLNKGQVRGGRRRSDPIGYGMMGGIVILLLLLAAQYMHASRETFATYGAFNQTLGSVYRALGNPVTPQWNIKGWQFEKTNGSTDDSNEVLTVFSQIRNASDKPLPYPLVHVSLTDRWEEVIGSNVLEPAEYLAGDLDPRQPVAPGDTFRAVIAIEEPSPEATGFQLYACYRLSPGRMRCATEDFKN